MYRRKWELPGRREDLLGSLVAIAYSTAAGGAGAAGVAAGAGAAGAAGGRACTDLVVRTWLERPKLLLGAYVSAIAEHDVAVSENKPLLFQTFLMKMIIVYVKREALDIIRNIIVALLRNIRKET